MPLSSSGVDVVGDDLAGDGGVEPLFLDEGDEEWAGGGVDGGGGEVFVDGAFVGAGSDGGAGADDADLVVL